MSFFLLLSSIKKIEFAFQPLTVLVVVLVVVVVVILVVVILVVVLVDVVLLVVVLAVVVLAAAAAVVFVWLWLLLVFSKSDRILDYENTRFSRQAFSVCSTLTFLKIMTHFHNVQTILLKVKALFGVKRFFL